MGSARRKISLTELDENSIVASFKEAEMPQAAPPCEVPAVREKARKGEKEENGGEYVRLFVRESPVCARTGKTIYLRREFHERIQRIVQTIGNNRVTIFSYVDNVLEKHFADYQEEIEKEYRKRNTGIF